jgi:hypothetical protein
LPFRPTYVIIEHMFDTIVDQDTTAQAAVDALAPLLDALAAVDWEDLDHDTLSRCVVGLSAYRDRLEGLCHLVIGAHDRMLAWKADGARSEKEWLATHCGTSMGEAAGRTETARRLGRLPATAQALADGTIRPAHARVAAKAARDLPGAALAGLDQLVAAQAVQVDAAALRSAVDDYAIA